MKTSLVMTKCSVCDEENYGILSDEEIILEDFVTIIIHEKYCSNCGSSMENWREN